MWKEWSGIKEEEGDDGEEARIVKENVEGITRHEEEEIGARRVKEIVKGMNRNIKKEERDDKMKKKRMKKKKTRKE